MLNGNTSLKSLSMLFYLTKPLTNIYTCLNENVQCTSLLNHCPDVISMCVFLMNKSVALSNPLTIDISNQYLIYVGYFVSEKNISTNNALNIGLSKVTNFQD